MLHFLTFANNIYKIARERIVKEAEHFGQFDTITAYTEDDLSENFKEKHKRILKEKFGGGYYIWKPYIILKKFKEINDNDYLVYCDAGSCVNKNGIQRFNQYKTLLDDYGCICFEVDFGPELKWTKNEIFYYFNSSDDDKNSQ